MDSQTFLSPRKRRSSALDGDAAGLMSPIRSKKSSNLLKKAAMSTPTHNNVLPFDAPITPGAVRSTSRMETPEKQQQQQGPSSGGQAPLAMLPEYLNALFVTGPMVLKRGTLLTFSSIKTPVQNMTGRNLKVQHLQQIKGLVPGAFDWRHVLVPSPVTKRQEQQLLLLLPDKAGQAQVVAALAAAVEEAAHLGSADAPSLAPLPPPAAAPSRGDATPSRHTSSSSTSAAAAVGYATPGAGGGDLRSTPLINNSAVCAGLMSPAAGGGTPGVPTPVQAAGPSTTGVRGSLFSPVQPPRRGRLGGAASAAATTTRATRLFGGAGPKTTQQQQQQQQGETAAAAAVAPGAKTAPRLPANLLTSPVQQGKTPAVPRFNTPERHRGALGDASLGSAELASPPLKVRKLSFDDCPDKAPAEAAAAAAGQASNSSSSKAGASAAGSGGGKRLGGGLVFEPGEGVMALLQAATNKPAQAAVAAVKADRAFDRQLDLLPATFDSLRAVYGDRGPCVLPKKELLLQLRQRSASRSGLSGEDAAQQLDLVTRLVPGWVTEVTAPGQQLAGLTTNVRLNRRLPWTEARAKMMAGAAAARANQGAAAAARAADAAAAAQEASAAAAAAAEQQQEEGVAAGSGEGVLVVVVDEAKAAALGRLGLPGKENRLAAAAAVATAAAVSPGSGGSSSGNKKADAVATRQQRLAALGMFDSKGPSSGSGSSAKAAAGAQGGGLAACLAFTAPAAVTPGRSP